VKFGAGRANRRFQFQKGRQLSSARITKLSAAQDRASIVFDCRIVNDPAMMSSTIHARSHDATDSRLLIPLPKCRIIRHNSRHAAFQSLSPGKGRK
jgi:hypothetical protein